MLFKWVLCIFIFSSTSNEVRVIESYVKYDTQLECNQARLRPGMVEAVRNLLRVKGVASVTHKCVQIVVKQTKASRRK